MGKVQVQLGQLETFHSRWDEGPHDNMYRMVSHTTDETREIAVFLALVYFAEVCLSMPVSNAWQEHGCSGLEQVKIRLRTQLSPEMLQTCLAVTINGSEVQSAAMDVRKSLKKWRKFPRDSYPIVTRDASDMPCSHNKWIRGGYTRVVLWMSGRVWRNEGNFQETATHISTASQENARQAAPVTNTAPDAETKKTNLLYLKSSCSISNSGFYSTLSDN